MFLRNNLAGTSLFHERAMPAERTSPSYVRLLIRPFLQLSVFQKRPYERAN